ncbi:MAG: ABC transporter substrate-binding protein [Candidatus Tectomicrobia bacterium]|uniref:ABC transporter substrate-binding protein n=1 Tax=Tectimicrobiota bacterium TaxID=2528274 RepID=A0A937VWY8_UNCTE|nr:ABC transporter substrate-binding protein [Candidatus Tectomicrobia bacterium]
MRPSRWFGLCLGVILSHLVVLGSVTAQPAGELRVAVATFGNERWLPHLYVGAEDIALKPMYENLLTRDPKTGELAPMLAERWEVLDGGKAWRFHLRQGVAFHHGQGTLTAEDVKFTFATLMKEGSANSLAPEFRLIKEMVVEGPQTLTIHFEQPFVAFGNKVTQGLFSSVAFIHPQKYLETAGEEGAERRPVGTGPWQFVEHVRGDRITYEAVDKHWRATPHFKRLVLLKVPEPATRMAMLRAGSVDVIEIGGEYAEELQKVGVRTLLMPNVAWLYIILGGQWPGKATYDANVPWALPDAERAKKVRLALNLAVDKKAIMERILGNLGTVTGAWLSYPHDPWSTEASAKALPYDPAKAKALLAEAGYPKGFELTMNLTAWPGRGYLPDVGEAVATYWEKIGLKIKRRPLDRAVFAADFRARAYPGVALAYSWPLVGPEPWELLIRGGYSKAGLCLFMEHEKLDSFIERLVVQPDTAERSRIMREEMVPWLVEYMPGVPIGAMHTIAGVGPRVGEWPLIQGHMGFHNWEYVTQKR